MKYVIMSKDKLYFWSAGWGWVGNKKDATVYDGPWYSARHYPIFGVVVYK